LKITALPAPTLADLKATWPGWDLSIKRHGWVRGIRRAGIRGELRAASLTEMHPLITSYEQGAAERVAA
jgi:hypothetical protein